MPLQNIQKMIRLTLGREDLTVLHNSQFCGVMADCLLTRSTALQKPEDDLVENNDVGDDIPDIVIVSLLVVKWRMRKMFPGGHCCQHLGSGFSWKEIYQSGIMICHKIKREH